MENSFADIKNRPIKADINGDTYLLEYDFNAYALLEELCGMSVFTLRDRIFENMLTLKELLILFYCALLRHQPEFDIEKLKNTPHVGAVLQKNLEAVYRSFFEPLLPPEIESLIETKVE